MSTLMVSISGIRGIVGDGLEPDVLVNYTSAYADFCGKGKIVIGSDGRISGEMVRNIVVGTLLAKGNDVVDIGICPTPTVLFSVKKLNAVGGIQISASHNPNEWNALKLLNKNGEFMSAEENTEMMKNVYESDKKFERWNRLGKLTKNRKAIQNHIDAILNSEIIDLPKIRKRKFKILLDCVNGAGSYSMPLLLKKLGCKIVEMNCEKSGIFPRLPEPIPENLSSTMEAVLKNKVDLGIVVDPDVDRLVLITETGELFGEENTITQAVKYYLSKKRGNVVVNLSTTRAVDDAVKEFNCQVFRAPVGEANVVNKMKEVNAVIGGEGSGGVILPQIVFGRDALTGTALTLQHLVRFRGKLSSLKKSLPQYFIVKKKIELKSAVEGTTALNADEVIKKIIEKYKSEKINTEDGLRIDFDDHWVHYRKSNTEPIIRCIVEAKTKEEAESLAEKYCNEIKN
jgi:phosphomannomutase